MEEGGRHSEGGYDLTRIEGNKKQLYDEEGLVDGLIRVTKKDEANFKVAREVTLAAMTWITSTGDAVEQIRKGLYEHPGLITALVSVVGKEGTEWKVARESALVVMWNIACGGEEVKKGLYDHEGLIALLVTVVGKGRSEK